MKKGFWRTFESVLAVMILVFFMLTLGVRYATLPPEADLPERGYKMLKDLDNRGELRPYVVNNQTDALESKISITGYNHAVQICSPENVCYGEEPGGLNVWVSTYLVSGWNTYDPYEVKLFMW